MFEGTLKLLLMSIMPGVEARAAIAYAVLFLKLKSPIMPLLLSLPTIAVGILVYYFLEYLEWKIINSNFLRMNVLRKIYFNYLANVRSRSRKYIEKYGQIGLILFIAIPFPGSGAWTGALVARIFNVEESRTVVSIVLGVLLSSYVSYIISMMGIGLAETLVV